MINHQEFRVPRLRVCLITWSLQPGGAERWVVTLARHFQGFRVTSLIDLSGAPGPLLKEIPRDIPVLYQDPESNPLSSCIDTALALGCDIIVGWGDITIPNIESCPVPVVLVSHATPEGPVDPTPPSAHFLAAVSQGSATSWPAQLRDSVDVLYNGVPLDRLDPLVDPPEQRDQWGIPRDNLTRVALYMGRFSAEKNPGAMLQVLPYLPNHWVVAMHGWGPMLPELIAQAPNYCRKTGGTSNLFFPKPTPNSVGSIYRAADVVVIPSHREAFPLTLIEAWLTRTPVIITDQPILRELAQVFSVDPSVLATIIPIDPTPRQLGDAIVAPVDEAAIEERFIIASRHFTAAKMIARWESYLLECIRLWQSTSLISEVQYIEPKQ